MDSGGSERQTWNLLRGLDRTILDPRLYLLYRQGPLLDQMPADVPIEAYWDNYTTPKLNWPGRVHRNQIKRLAEILQREKIDVVYERLFHMAMIVGPAARRAGVRHVANIVSPPRSDVPRSEIKFAWLKRRFLARAYREADRLLAVSQGAADDAAKYYGIDRSRFEVVWNPVDLERIDRLKMADWHGKPIHPDRFKMVSVGRLSYEKGHAVLIHAFANVIKYLQEKAKSSGQTSLPLAQSMSSTNTPRLTQTITTTEPSPPLAHSYGRGAGGEGPLPLELHLIGDGPLRSELEKLALDLGVADRVIFHGYLDNPFPFLHQSQLFVLPSLYEGLPNALLEAMALEVPTLATDCPGGIREATDDGSTTVLCQPNDCDSLAKAILSRVENLHPWLDRIPIARKKIEAKHSYPAWLRKMQSILLGGQP
jgi:glycosyltransferase involved in cell wall biosynthesis